jgi:hypothetical protein
MSNIEPDPRRQRSALIIRLPVARIEPERDVPGWLVIRGSYGWLYGSRREALHAAHELTYEMRP